MSLATGTRIGPFLVKSSLGEGGMGVVFRALAAILFLTTIFFAACSVVTRPKPPAPLESRLEVNTPSGGDPFSFAISPDGRRLVFSASNKGKTQLWVRLLDSVAAQQLALTDGASYPFWSPDSASVGFFADGKLKRIDIGDGRLHVLANAAAGRGGAWNRDGTIVFTPNFTQGIFRISAAGGEAMAVTRLEAGQSSHLFPQFLPDGGRFIYFVQGGPEQGIYAGSLDGGSSRRLANADAAAVISPSGFLLFRRETTLFAQVFDLKKQQLSGTPFPVVEHAAFDAGTYAAGFSAAAGILAYRTGSVVASRQLTWLDRSGKSVGTIGAPDVAVLTDVELSPDGKHVAVERNANGNRDVWLIDAARGVLTRFTFDAASDGWPVWSPDGRRIVFQSSRKGASNLYWKLSNSTGVDELLLESNPDKAPADWSSDGRLLLFNSVDPRTGQDLWVLPFFGDKKPFPFLKTPFNELEGQFSPDGKWVAYQSNETGQFEIYVQPFTGPGGKFQISISGGAQPRWNKNGKEIFYVSLDSKVMTVPVKSTRDAETLQFGTPATLFPVRIAGGPVQFANRQQYAVSADGQRFLVNAPVDEGTTSPITIIYNWKPSSK